MRQHPLSKGQKPGISYVVDVMFSITLIRIDTRPLFFIFHKAELFLVIEIQSLKVFSPPLVRKLSMRTPW